jgi:Carboxypeptidase regulatory-like domain
VPTPLEAEAPATGAIQGTVADEKSRIPGFEIKLRLPDGSEQKTVSNADGRFTFDRLAAGTYRLEARLEGYADTVEPKVIVRAGETVEIQLVPKLLPFGPVVSVVDRFR